MLVRTVVSRTSVTELTNNLRVNKKTFFPIAAFREELTLWTWVKEITFIITFVAFRPMFTSNLFLVDQRSAHHSCSGKILLKACDYIWYCKNVVLNLSKSKHWLCCEYLFWFYHFLFLMLLQLIYIIWRLFLNGTESLKSFFAHLIQLLFGKVLQVSYVCII